MNDHLPQISNRKVAEEWINRRNARGSNFYSVNIPGGATILYSYATPIAYQTDTEVVFDKKGYSTTTRRQRGIARNMLFAMNIDYVDVDHEDFMEQCKLLAVNMEYAR